ncbi:branched-chain amino acid ABC transporter permease [Nocardioides seonyuensis]|uniref:Branched-chain amino acid ABC transporter permease n=1 Tax=Nocardioides seonyuensis TaxID=2518371 RepID=A0A4P7IEZ0_9ACTN|nr:branched-chain amino acid ABC transporter permease [Nocardioides seonyuensis]QBX55796.1 branched-chain amino acid ABC transporter permease [Nocardioides seonyuensis]
MRRFTPVGLGLALVVALAVLPLLSIQVPGILPGPTYTPGALQLLALCMVYASLALSYNLLLGTGGLLSFGHALYFGAGAYGLGILLERTDLSLWPAIGLTLVGAGAVAVLTGAVSLRVSGIPFAMVTLAFAQAGSVLVRRNPEGLTGGEEGLSLDTEHVPAALVGVVNTRNLYWLALAIVVVAYLVVLWIDRSRVGHVAAAARENELRVRALGLQPYTAKLVVFVAGGLIASLTGVMYLLLQSGTVPRAVGADLTITVLVMVVLGGVGSRWGAIVGGVIYTLLNQRLTLLAGSDAVDSLPAVLHVPLSEPMFILGALFILVVLFVPGGIAGTTRRLTGRDRTRSGSAVLEAADQADDKVLEPQP